MTEIIHCLKLLFLGVAGFVVVGITHAAGQGVEQELTEEQRQELELLASAVSTVLQSQSVWTEQPLDWVNEFLKSSKQTTFVPFTFSVEQRELSTPTIAIYILVEPQQAMSEPERCDPVFEEAYHIELGAPTLAGAYEISAGFWGQSGDYDVYVAVSESEVSSGTEPRTLMFKKEVSIPNLWSEQLAASSVILAERIDVLPSPPSPSQLLLNPYTLGNLRVIPKMTPEYSPPGEFISAFFIYNAGLTVSGMPDVRVDYTFSTRGVEGGQFFDRTTPQMFNERTLPQDFDVTAGHQLAAGQIVPLSALPVDDYRLVIKVTDNTNGAVLMRSVDFSVASP